MTTKTKRAKAVKAWAVTSSSGMDIFSISNTFEGAIERYITDGDNGQIATWYECKTKYGCVVIPVLITPSKARAK